MTSKGFIFLSYRNIEAEFALKLAADLKNSGIPLWMDRLEVGIKAGDDWRHDIETAVNDCAAMIVVLSPEYVSSKYCRREIARADTLEHPVFPILLHAVPREDWPIEVQRTQYVDFRQWQEETFYRQSLNNLVGILTTNLLGHVDDVPDQETQYVNTLIADLEARKGVLEYVELSVEAKSTSSAIRPPVVDNMGWEPEFALLERQPETHRSAQPVRKPVRIGNGQSPLERFSRFVLVGEPGSGKTTMLRRLALDSARAKLSNPRLAPIPLLLYLPAWTDESTPIDFIRRHWPLNTGGIEQSLFNGEVKLYLDGLNEMGSQGLTRARLLRDWLHSDNAPKYVVISCRESDYSESFDLGLPTIATAMMKEAQIRQFAVNYLGQDSGEIFLSKILPHRASNRESARQLFRLARNPYLLAALIVIYKNSPSGELPLNNGALFKALANALWERERRRQTSGWIPFDEMEKLFGRLAFTMIDEGLPVDISREQATRFLEKKLWFGFKKSDSQQLIKAGQSANLLEIRGDQIRFFHQLVLEYFAAAALKSRRKLIPISPSSFDQIYGSRLATKWDEVLTALCGIADDPDRVVQEIAQTDPWLAARQLPAAFVFLEIQRQKSSGRCWMF